MKNAKHYWKRALWSVSGGRSDPGWMSSEQETGSLRPRGAVCREWQPHRGKAKQN